MGLERNLLGEYFAWRRDGRETDSGRLQCYYIYRISYMYRPGIGSGHARWKAAVSDRTRKKERKRSLTACHTVSTGGDGQTKSNCWLENLAKVRWLKHELPIRYGASWDLRRPCCCNLLQRSAGTERQDTTASSLILINYSFIRIFWSRVIVFNPLNPELNPICYLLALLAHHFLHVSKIRVKSLTLRLLMSYIYIHGAPILDVSRSHTTTQHSR